MTRYLLTMGIAAAALAACQTPSPPSPAPQAANETGSVLVSASSGMPGQRPGWLSKGNEASEKDGFRYFVGSADNQASETECKNAAFADGVRVIARHAGVEVALESVRHVRGEGSSGGPIEERIQSDEKGSMAARAIISGAAVADFFWEKFETKYEGRVMGRHWKCWALVNISKANLDRAAVEKGAP